MTQAQRSAWVLLVTGMLVTMVSIVFARLAFGLLVPGMRAGLGVSYGDAANLASGSALGYLGLVLAAGGLAARHGARTSVLLGTVLVTLGFAGMALASHYAVLMALMLLLGIGTAFSYTPMVSLVAARFAERRGLAIGLLSSGIGVGMLFVGLLVPAFTAQFGNEGWRWVWAVFGAVGALCIGAVLLVLPRGGGHATASLHVQPSESKAAVYRNRRVIAVGLLYCITGMVYISQATFMYSYSLEAGVAPALAGMLAASMGVLSIPAAPLWGLVSDRIGRGRGILIALTAALAAMLVPVFVPNVWGFGFHYVVMGLTISGLFTNILAAANEEVTPLQAPVAVSYVTFYFAAGQLMGPFVSGRIIDYSGSFRAVFVCCCLLIAVGIVIALRFNRQAARAQ